MLLSGFNVSPFFHALYRNILSTKRSVSLCFKKIDGIRYSQHVDTCCTSLLMLEECGSDSSLVAAVRLQCIIEKMQDVFLPRHVPYDTIRAPIALHVNAFQAELKAFKASLSEDIQQNCKQSASHYLCPQVTYVDA